MLWILINNNNIINKSGCKLSTVIQEAWRSLLLAADTLHDSHCSFHSVIYQVHRLFSYSSSLLMIILLLFNYSFPVHLHYFTRGLSIWIINSTINMYYSDINYKWSIKLVYISKNKCWKRRRMLGQPFWLILLLIPFHFITFFQTHE